MRQREQKGVALVVTLILLAVITIVVVAFLAVSQRNRQLLSTASDFIDAKLMSDAALSRAQAEIAARMLARSNVNAFEMLVSTNFTRTTGYISGTSGVLNVSYTYDYVYDPSLGTPLSYPDLMNNLTNLYYDPRPPVFIPNNPANPFSRDFRFYLDLNRNGRFDPTAYQTIVDQFGNRDVPDRNGAISNFFVGDPEWIGVLERPDQKHSSSNRFIGRYAYVVVPEGLSLDLNAIHNYARFAGSGAPPAGDGFVRNMGVGTWEMNLAGFLVGLNTNSWPASGQFGNNSVDYTYVPGNLSVANSGYAFQDALSLLFYRYRTDSAIPGTASIANLLSYQDLYGGFAGDIFRTDLIDGYSDGPLMLDEVLPRPENPQDPVVGTPWSGSPTPSQYFSQDDLFNARKVDVDFLLRLDNATRGVGSYNSGTYYRLLSSLGTKSGAEPESFVPGSGLDAHADPRIYLPEDKMNLNFDNRDLRGQTPAGPRLSATQVQPWEPLGFFTNAADRILRSQGFVGSDGRIISLTNIMVWPTNNYDSAVHRCLQVAANLFDATTNFWTKAQPLGPEYPSVFRPFLRKERVNGIWHVYVAGFQRQDLIQGGQPLNPAGFVSRLGYWNLNASNTVDLIPERPDANQVQPMALGVPLVIGAKKGYPNFNELAIQTVVQAQRNLLVGRPTQASLPDRTNQVYILSVSNVFGLESWNSYRTDFPRTLQLAVEVDFASTIQNSSNVIMWPRDLNTGVIGQIEQTYAVSTNLAAFAWAANGYQVPLFTNNIVITNSVWNSSSLPFFRPTDSAIRRQTGGIGVAAVRDLEPGFPIPDWQIYMTNRIRYVLVDNGRIVDYVNIDGMTKRVNVMEEMLNRNNITDGASIMARMWDMDRVEGSTDVNDITRGIELQFMVSAGFVQVPRSDWADYSPTIGDKDKAIEGFRGFLGFPPLNPAYGGAEPRTAWVQAPFTAARKLFIDRKYQVNDPLVHYTYQDIYDRKVDADNRIPNVMGLKVPFPSLAETTLGQLNQLYSPWGGNPLKDAEGNLAAYNPAYTDPGITESEAWNFPTNKFPSLGWMGRVHRGSPWQTIYMKSLTRTVDVGNGLTNAPIVDAATWELERGNPLTLPSSDWKMFDLFTVAPNSLATRGRLSVNQSGEAAWSAVLAGVAAMTNDTGSISLSADTPEQSASRPLIIEPGTPQLYRIVDGINRTRTNGANGYFSSRGEVLATPELSISSPFLSTDLDWSSPSVAQRARLLGLSDVAMERIPQQIMSLLRLGEPQVVIYAFGQSLAPARNSINLDPDYYQVVTNYQVTGEYVTRSVVRFEGDATNPTNRTLNAVVVESKVLPPQ